MADMTRPGRFDHLRHSALDLLTAGRPVASVAESLAVPTEVVRRWQSERIPASAARLDALRHQRAQGGANHFRTTLTLAPPLRFRLWYLLVAAFILVGTLNIVGQLLAQPASARGPSPWLSLPLTGALCAFGFLFTLMRGRALLVLGEDDVRVAPRFARRRAIAYAELAHYTLVSSTEGNGDSGEIEGRLLTLHSRREGVAALEVFIDDRFPVDPALFERLDEVCRANQGAGPLPRVGESRLH